VAEQFNIEALGRHRRTIEHDEGLVGATGVVVQIARHSTVTGRFATCIINWRTCWIFSLSPLRLRNNGVPLADRMRLCWRG
jgi:hypothetical protein